jgi:hypothetical protein
MSEIQTRATLLLNASTPDSNPSSVPLLTLNSASYGVFNISWNVLDDGGCQITNYIVAVINKDLAKNQSFTYQVSGNTSHLSINDNLSPTTHTGINKFTVGDTYDIFVVGVNSLGNTSLSNDQEAVFTSAIPHMPVISNYNFGIDGAFNLIIGGTDASQTDIQFDIVIQNLSETLKVTGVTSTTPIIHGLSQGDSYNVTVKASNSLGSSDFSSPITVAVPSAIPASDDYQPLSPPLVNANAYDKKVICQWSDVSTTSSYMLKLRDLTTKNMYVYNITGGNGKENFTFSSLVNNNTYEISAMSFDSSGFSRYSTPIKVIPKKTPDPVTSIDAVFCGDGVIHVFYQYPDVTPGHTYVFELTAINESDSSVLPVSSGSISAHDFKFVNLVDKDFYTITIQAFDTATNDASNLVMVGENIIATSIGCFLEGTHLLNGEKSWTLIEDVKVGDYLWSPSIEESAKVTRVYRQVLPIHPKTLPICLEKADPRFQLKRDLYLSPMHAVYLNGKFYEAHHLPFVDRVFIQKEIIIYYNIELEGSRDPFKYTLCAEGLMVESQGDRNSIGRDGLYYQYSEDFTVASSC